MRDYGRSHPFSFSFFQGVNWRTATCTFRNPFFREKKEEQRDGQKMNVVVLNLISGLVAHLYLYKDNFPFIPIFWDLKRRLQQLQALVGHPNDRGKRLYIDFLSYIQLVLSSFVSDL